MMRRLFAAVLTAGALVGGLFAEPVRAQSVIGQPTLNNFMVGQGAADPVWLPPNQVDVILGTRITNNAQTGTSYAYGSADDKTLVSTSNAGAISSTLGVQAAGWGVVTTDLGAGTNTISGTGGVLFNGASSLAIATGDGYFLSSPGTVNVQAMQVGNFNKQGQDVQFWGRQTLFSTVQGNPSNITGNGTVTGANYFAASNIFYNYPSTHNGGIFGALAITTLAQGTNLTSPDFGLVVSCQQVNYLTTAVIGECDGITAQVLHGVNETGDAFAAGIRQRANISGLAGAQTQQFEGQTDLVNGSALSLARIHTTLGQLDVGNTKFGFGIVTEAEISALDTAYLVDTQDQSAGQAGTAPSWQYAFRVRSARNNANNSVLLTPAGVLTLGLAGTGTGSIVLNGTTSGSATITPQAAAGTPTLTIGTNSGTPAVTANGPLAISSSTGNITCLTCATTTNGGALSATSPMSISAAGVISIVDLTSGQVLGGSPPAFTATPTLGVPSSITGTLGFASNANTGTATIQYQGTATNSTLTLGTTTGTLVASASSPLSINVITGVISASVFVASGASHATGIVPDPGASAGTTRFLREDATFAVPPGVPGGSSLQVQYNNAGAFGGANVWRTGANQLDLSNGVNAQQLRVYKTTDNDGGAPTNAEWGVFDWTTTANVLTIAQQSAGTGTAREIDIVGSSSLPQIRVKNLGTDFTRLILDGGTGGGNSNNVAFEIAHSGTRTWGMNSFAAGGTNKSFTFFNNVSSDSALFVYGDTDIVAFNAGGSPTVSTTAGLTSTTAKVLAIKMLDNSGYAWLNYIGQTRVTSDFSVTSNTVLAAVTGLQVNVEAGRTYHFDIELLMTTGASAGGIKIGVGGTATITNLLYDAIAIDGTTVLAHTARTAFGAGNEVIAVTNTGTAPVAHIFGTLTVNAAGTFQVRFAQNASSATASVVKQGSTFIVQDMP